MHPSDLTPERVPHSSTSRRTFLGRTAAGVAAGGLVWAAPSILTLDAAAAASCGVGGTLNWSNFALNAAPGATTVNTVLVTPSHTDTSGVGTAQDNHVLPGPQGTVAPYYAMVMISPTTGQEVTTTFTFSKAVNSLSFTILDIDFSTGAWKDLVYLVATGPSGAVGFTFTKPAGSSVTGTGASAATAFTNTVSIGTGSNLGNVTVTFSAPVTSVVIHFRSGNPTGTQQVIGLGNLTWTGCT